MSAGPGSATLSLHAVALEPALAWPHLAIWAIAAVCVIGMLTRALRLTEAWWAVAGAAVLCLSGLLPWHDAWLAIGKGLDVYLFLGGMMLATEVARHEGLFDHVAARAACLARGSAKRLFLLVYAVGTVVTVFLSNDATAVVLTPAVLAVTRAARTAHPLPYLYVCAFVANAASFVLPISNPANLVVFQHGMPPLLPWLERFALASALSIGTTFAVLRFTQRHALAEAIAAQVDVPPLTAEGRTTALGLAGMAVAMLAASAAGIELGWPTLLAGLAMYAAVCGARGSLLREPVRHVSWSVLPLVAGLFVVVAGLERTGMLRYLAGLVQDLAARDPATSVWASGVAVALAANVVNNLPAGLVAGNALADAPSHLANAVLIGIDLGPNLSITGSLATLLWLGALRREGLHVGAWQFLRLGTVVMLPALLLALGAVVMAA